MATRTNTATYAISPTLDEQVVGHALERYIRPAAGQPGMHAYAAELATQYLAEQVRGCREQRWMCPHYSQAAEVADAVRGIGPNWDRESREVEASLARTDAFCRANPGSGVTS